MSIQAAVTRSADNGADIFSGQAIAIPQAVLLYTGRSRQVVDMPRVGVIAPGYEASLMTPGHDIFEVDPDSMIDLKVTGNWVQGTSGGQPTSRASSCL